MANYDEEEQEIINTFDAGELKSKQPGSALLERHRAYATNTTSKEIRCPTLSDCFSESATG